MVTTAELVTAALWSPTVASAGYLLGATPWSSGASRLTSERSEPLRSEPHCSRRAGAPLQRRRPRPRVSISAQRGYARDSAAAFRRFQLPSVAAHGWLTDGLDGHGSRVGCRTHGAFRRRSALSSHVQASIRGRETRTGGYFRRPSSPALGRTTRRKARFRSTKRIVAMGAAGIEPATSRV